MTMMSAIPNPEHHKAQARKFLKVKRNPGRQDIIKAYAEVIKKPETIYMSERCKESHIMKAKESAEVLLAAWEIETEKVLKGQPLHRFDWDM